MCDWDGCGEIGTHAVAISFPDLPTERWDVCGAHDRQLKLAAVLSRPKKPAVPPGSLRDVVRCDGCGMVLDERPPCPACGSRSRGKEMNLQDRIETRHHLPHALSPPLTYRVLPWDKCQTTGVIYAVSAPAPAR